MHVHGPKKESHQTDGCQRQAGNKQKQNEACRVLVLNQQTNGINSIQWMSHA